MAMLPQVELSVFIRGGAEAAYKTEDDLGLYLKSYSYTPPEVKTEYVSVPGREGDLDFTESLYGDNGTVHYGNGTLELVFKVPDINSYQYAMVVASFHGHRVTAHITNGFTSSFVFVGRLSVSPLESAKYSGYITMTVNVESRRNA